MHIILLLSAQGTPPDSGISGDADPSKSGLNSVCKRSIPWGSVGPRDPDLHCQYQARRLLVFCSRRAEETCDLTISLSCKPHVSEATTAASPCLGKPSLGFPVAGVHQFAALCGMESRSPARVLSLFDGPRSFSSMGYRNLRAPKHPVPSCFGSIMFREFNDSTATGSAERVHAWCRIATGGFSCKEDQKKCRI